MSIKNRRNQYNEQVKKAEEGSKIKVNPKLIEEFGKYGKAEKKGEEKPLKENTDDLPEE